MTAGRYRLARLLRDGWQVRLAGGGWATVAGLMVVYEPLPFVRIDLDGGDWAVVALDAEVRSRTITEQSRGRSRPRE